MMTLSKIFISYWVVCHWTDVNLVAGRNVIDELYPPFEEYDATILDPLHAYGSPYGGFSRATRRRLAALPLPLPELTTEEVDESAESWEPFYTTVRDGTTGHLFACRVYHEDEVLPQSLMDSLFEPPLLRSDAAADNNTQQQQSQQHQSQQQQSETTNKSGPKIIQHSTSSNPGYKSLEIETKDGVYKMPENKDGSAVLDTKDTINMMRVTKRLKSLEGLCAQIHKGWWSYEWCYETNLVQFHVQMSKETVSLEIQDITLLGSFERREWNMDLTNADRNPLAGNLQEVARVTEIHEGGTICPDTGKPRRASVNLMCCTDEIMAQKRTILKKDNSLLAKANELAVYEIEEQTTCHYNVTVCTPLLCAETSDETETNAAKQKKAAVPDRHEHKEGESIMEILERTLGGDKPVCLQSITGGWWTFEFCHGESIRQYHEIVGTKRDKNGNPQTTRIVETDHNLGMPQTNIFRAIVPEEEWRFMVNATDKKGTKNPYFELEYINGDICNDDDVKDAAIVAGASGVKGLARSSSVRYSCGERYDITVSEDSTCHYVVNIVVPDLCRHPLFKTPVSKKQIFKCLPVEDSGVNENNFLM